MGRHFKGICGCLALLAMLVVILYSCYIISIEIIVEGLYFGLIIPILFVYGAMHSSINLLGVLSEEFRDYAHYRDFYLKSKSGMNAR